MVLGTVGSFRVFIMEGCDGAVIRTYGDLRSHCGCGVDEDLLEEQRG